MKPASSKKRFLQLVKTKADELASLSVIGGIALMIRFYEEERAVGCSIEDDGDMLLYQWGCSDYGNGETFELNITRQFMEAAGEDEDIRQLSLTFKYQPSGPMRKIRRGNRWCPSPDDVAKFAKLIQASAAFKAATKAKPVAVTLELQTAG